MYRKEAIICQHLYWLGIREIVWKEVINCDTCQGTKKPNKNGNLLSKEAEEMPRNKLCVDLIGPYVTRRK